MMDSVHGATSHSTWTLMVITGKNLKNFLKHLGCGSKMKSELNSFANVPNSFKCIMEICRETNGVIKFYCELQTLPSQKPSYLRW